MRKISWNWVRGGMLGGLRLAYHNVHRVTDQFRHNPEVCDLAYKVETDVARLMNMVAQAKDPRRYE